jgi:hypothetical protein
MNKLIESLQLSDGRRIRWARQEHFELEDRDRWSTSERKELVNRIKQYIRSMRHPVERYGEDPTLEAVLENEALMSTTDPVKSDNWRLMEFVRQAIDSNPEFDAEALDKLL